MIKINESITASDLETKLKNFWQLSAQKIKLIENNYDVSKGSPVFTVNGNYTTRGWTEWTQGFQYGSMILQYDATGETSMLEAAKKKTVEAMAPHVSHTGVHDHGFNRARTNFNQSHNHRLRQVDSGKHTRTAACCCQRAC